MNTSSPMVFRYDGEGAWSAPSPHWGKRADAAYVIGQDYLMVEAHERSQKSHDHYFAAVTESWKNLPENVSDQFPTSEHLRAYALIKAGFADSQTFVCTSRAEAERFKLFLRPIDPYSVVTTTGATVTRWTAQSQSKRAMGNAEFQRSKEGVLGIISAMIGTSTAEMQAAARAA